MTIYINGRFLTQPLSGVQRFAIELLRAFDALLARDQDMRHRIGPVNVLVPAGCAHSPDWQVLSTVTVAGGQGHFWEQGPLYRASRDGVLVSFGNSGPLRHRAHVLTLHDAHIFEIPQAFRRRYLMLHRTLRPRLARRALQLITVSGHSADRLGHHLGLDPARFRVIPNAADHVVQWPKDPATPRRYGLSPGGYLLALGNQSPNKNIAALVQAHRATGAQVCDLVLVGGPAPGVAAQQSGPSPRVTHLGRVPDADLAGLIGGACGFVFPSLHEGFGIPPLEAMQLGVPVLCARSGAMPDCLGDAPTWFDPRQVADITAALERFARLSPTQRSDMIQAGHQQATRYSWAASADQLASLLAALPSARWAAPAQGRFAGSTPDPT